MKFRTIFIVFNVVIVLSFLFIFFVPLVLLGGSYFSLFVSRNWVAAVLFAVTLVLVNLYFLRNWKLFHLLEREEWSSLIELLEGEVYRKKPIRANHVRLLINSYLITSNLEAAGRLEEETRRRAPALMSRLAIPFGVRHLLRAGQPEAEHYFLSMKESARVRDRPWLQWSIAFCLAQRGAREEAARELESLLGTGRDQVLELLTLYLLERTGPQDDARRDRVREGRARLRARHTREQWKRAVERGSGNMAAVILSRVLREAESWLFEEDSAAVAAGENESTTIH